MSKEITSLSNIRYKNPTLQEKWVQAVTWLRTSSSCGWILDKSIKSKVSK